MHSRVQQTLCLLLLCILNSASVAGQARTSCSKSWTTHSPSNNYSVNANIWNQGNPGSQCVSYLPEEHQFSATWWWRDGSGNSVRAYPHVKFFDEDLPTRLNRVSELAVRGSWNATVAPDDDSSQERSLSSVKAKFNVALDMFLHADPDLAQNETTAQYEIMVWVGSNNKPKPLGYSKGVQMAQNTASHSFSLYSGTNHRGIKTFSWLTEDDLFTFDLDLLHLAIPLVQGNLIPADSYLGLVEFGTESYYATDNVTFSANDFAMNLSTALSPTFDIPTPEVPGAGSCLQLGIMHRYDILAMIGLVYLYFHL